jgi:hypothetical protein
VDALWREILGDDYRAYAHRVGILYRRSSLACGGLTSHHPNRRVQATRRHPIVPSLAVGVRPSRARTAGGGILLAGPGRSANGWSNGDARTARSSISRHGSSGSPPLIERSPRSRRRSIRRL